MLRRFTEPLQKTTCEKLLSFLIYNVTFRHYDIQKETNHHGSFNIIHIYKATKNRTSNGGNLGEFFFGHSYILCHSFAVEIGLLSKMSRFMSIFTGLLLLNTILARKIFSFYEGALSGPRQFLATESPLKLMKNNFYFTL